MTDMLTRIDCLERRVWRVERHLGFAPDVPHAGVERSATPDASAPPVAGMEATMEKFDPYLQQEIAAPAPGPVPAPASAHSVAAELPQPGRLTPPPLPPLPPHSAPAPADIALGPDQPAAPAPDPAPAPAPNVVPAPLSTLRYEARPAPPVGPPKQSALEQVIGLKLAGWVGAIVLVIGAGLGIKYAYEQGFFSGVHPAMWLSLLYACGFALLGAGEFVYRRVNKISATGLFGAGVATLFLVSYAGHGYYALYQQQTAFTLMALSTLMGAAVAMRGKLVSIAALSLLGGMLAPLVLESDSNLLAPFLGYLLMLQVVALVLSWWGGSARWWTLRGLSLAGTSLWMGAILWRSQPWGAAMGFTFLSAVLYHAEVILSAFRRRIASSQDVELGAGVSFTVIVTAMLTAATLWLFGEATPAVRGIWVATFAAVAMLASLALAHLRDDDNRGKRLRALSYGYRAQAAVLLLLAIPVAFSGAGVSLGWAAVALGLAAIGAKLDDRAARYAAVAAWVLAILNGIFWTTNDPTQSVARAEWFTILGQPLLAWTVIGWTLAAVGHAIGWLISAREAKEAPVLSFLASGVFTAVTIAALPPLGATAVLLGYAWLLIGGDVLVVRLKFLPQAWTVLAVAVAKWVAVDTIAARMSPGWNAAAYTPLLNPLMLTGVALAGSIVAMYRIRRDAIQACFAAASEDGSTTTPAVVVLSAVALLIGLGLSFEVDRVVVQVTQSAWSIGQLRQMAWTMLWTIIAAAYLLIFTKLDPSASRRSDWRGAAWLVAGFLALKFIIIDTLLAGLRGSGAAAPAALLNLQTLTAIVVTGGLAFAHWLLRDTTPDARHDESAPLRVGFAATMVLLWAGTLEIDRLVGSGVFPGVAVWPASQLKNFAWSAWWTAGVTGFIAIATRRDDTLIRRLPLLRMLGCVPVLLAIKYLILDTLIFRLFRGPANTAVVANLQTFAGAILFGALILIRHWMSTNPDRRADQRDSGAERLRRTAGAILMIMLLWLGSLEIDRAFAHSTLVTGAFADPAIARQVALSIFWSAFAIASVAAGFKLRTAGLRYFGLALFALTLVKVGVVDLQNAETGYRILSFMGLGALLLVTSVLYGKLSPVLLRDERDYRDGSAQGGDGGKKTV